MREAKRQYLYANRKNKRKEDQLRKERMAEDICNNRSREFFKEVKKSYPKCGIAPSIDDQVESGVIADNCHQTLTGYKVSMWRYMKNANSALIRTEN